MSKLISLFLMLVLTLSFNGLVFAQEHTPSGARAHALGGAVTALAEGAEAIYWNPANRAGLDYSELILGRGGSFAFDYDEIDELDIFLNIGDHEDLSLPEDGEITIQDQAAISFQSFGVAFFEEKSYRSKVEDNYKQAEKLELKTGVLNLSTHRLPVFHSFGANIKGIYGSYDSLELSGEEESQNSFTGQGYSLDLGLLHSFSDWITVGVKARNLIADIDWEEDLSSLGNTLDRELAVGVKSQASGIGTLTGDIVFREQGVDTLHFGLERSILNALKLRAGAYQEGFNLEQDEETRVFTAGLGIDTSALSLDFSIDEAENIFVSGKLKF
ncbi:hypothetical protein [Fuchsiella alkaliacetigena]|uniref:hypothetical protein n=1 Tax=Fuchsiella alkaliacetigena TaxID=957042 RepID=UPI00200A4D19|nr:hypothetical protein [Fuchsiella alkaliacetigena]MCK8825753.1 hypothetical protein [Fuchsiella alkaliacetigena]